MIEINLDKILKIQYELNEKIKNTQHLINDQIKDQSRLALMVELMELCNETRCFNYWSKKIRSNDEIILEEFADVLCFTLSECLSYNVFVESTLLLIKDSEVIQVDKKTLTRLFLDLINTYSIINDKNSCKIFIEKLFTLGFKLGYTFDDILNAYEKKCIKNHSVQDNFNK